MSQIAPPIRPFETTIYLDEISDGAGTYKGTEYFYDSIPFRVPEKELDPKKDEWYRYQAILWSKITIQDPQNPYAWLNVFRSLKYLNSPEKSLDSLKNLILIQVPNSPVRYLTDYMTIQSDISLFKAFYLADSSLKTELYPKICLYFLEQNQTDSLNVHLNDWKKSSGLSDEALIYAYNLLSTCRKNSILVLSDFYEYWPVKYFQINGFRNDVKLIFLEQISNRKYYSSLNKSGLDLPQFSTNKKDFLEQLIQLNSAYPVYLSLALPKTLLRPIGSKLQCEGLAYFVGEYNSLSVYQVEENIKDVYNLNYLENDLSHNPINDTYYSRLNLNYIIPLLQVYDIYVYKDQAPDGIKYYNLALKIAKTKGLGDLVIGYRFSK
jgi:hypothetical protein